MSIKLAISVIQDTARSMSWMLWHFIQNYEKRLKWQNTIFAWFAKWLQDDASWWTEMYGDEKM